MGEKRFHFDATARPQPVRLRLLILSTFLFAIFTVSGCSTQSTVEGMEKSARENQPFESKVPIAASDVASYVRAADQTKDVAKPLRMVGVTVNGVLRLTGGQFYMSPRFYDCVFTDDVCLSAADLMQPVVFSNCTFEGNLCISHCQFQCPLQLTTCRFEGKDRETSLVVLDSRFQGCDLSGSVGCTLALTDANFCGPATLTDVRFEQLQMIRCHFSGRVSLRRATIQDACFGGVTFGDDLDLANWNMPLHCDAAACTRPAAEPAPGSSSADTTPATKPTKEAAHGNSVFSSTQTSSTHVGPSAGIQLQDVSFQKAVHIDPKEIEAATGDAGTFRQLESSLAAGGDIPGRLAAEDQLKRKVPSGPFWISAPRSFLSFLLDRLGDRYFAMLLWVFALSAPLIAAAYCTPDSRPRTRKILKLLSATLVVILLCTVSLEWLNANFSLIRMFGS